MIKGERFHRWTFEQRSPHADTKNPRGIFLCDCGIRKIATIGHIRSGRSKSCGCLNREVATTHGHTGSPTYVSWLAMVKRCTCPTDKEFARYRDVPLHNIWHRSFAAFLADVGERPEGTTLDRIDNSLGYVPGNVRWASRRVQTLNRISTVWVSVHGATMCAADAARALGISPRTVFRRLAAGLIERARD